MTHTVLYDRLPRHDPRLGRHVEHDSRSRLFSYPAEPLYNSTYHSSIIPTLDQGQYGSCTGNAAVKNLTYVDDPMTDDTPFWEAFSTQFPGVLSLTDAKADEAVAVSVYSDAEVIDGGRPFDPNDGSTDNGSTGLSVAKACLHRGWISGYRHAFSLASALSALSHQAVIVGTNWYTGMFDPTGSGELVIDGRVEGGHEYVLDEIDVEAERVWMQNSWGLGWGDHGRAWMTWATLERLLFEDGDCTIFTPLWMPAPIPEPEPGPGPVPVPDDPTELFVQQANYWIGLRHSSKPNVAFEKQTQAYLDYLAQQA